MIEEKRPEFEPEYIQEGIDLKFIFIIFIIIMICLGQ